MEDNKTEEKLKNPGRVKWGKQLALVSKQLKEAKKIKEAKEKEIQLIKTDIEIDKETKQTLDYYHIEMWIGFGGLAVAIITLYVQYKNKNQAIIPQSQVHVINQSQPNPFDF